VVVCENKLLLYDLNTRKPYEVPRAMLDGKAPSCVSFLFRGGRFAPGGQPDANSLMTSPVLAVGCADGVVRLMHLATLRVGEGQQAGGQAAGGQAAGASRGSRKQQGQGPRQQEAAGAAGGSKGLRGTMVRIEGPAVSAGLSLPPLQPMDDSVAEGVVVWW